MTAYLIALIKMTDAKLAQEYSAAAGPTIAAAGGKVVARGKIKELAGNSPAEAGLIVSFESIAELEAWYGGSAYRALICLYLTDTATAEVSKLHPYPVSSHEPHEL